MPWSTTRPRNAVHGAAHTRARKAWAAAHQPTDPCVRCGHPLGPMGRWLHLDHRDDHQGYLGFSHARCNIRAGALAGNRAQKAKRQGGQASALVW